MYPSRIDITPIRKLWSKKNLHHLIQKIEVRARLLTLHLLKGLHYLTSTVHQCPCLEIMPDYFSRATSLKNINSCSEGITVFKWHLYSKVETSIKTVQYFKF